MSLLVGSVLSILAAGVAAMALARRPRLGGMVFRALMTAGCVIGMIPTARAFAGHVLPPLEFRAGVPGGPWVFGLDPLSALFLLAILGVGLASAWYGVTSLHGDADGVMNDVSHSRVAVRVSHLFVAVLIAALMLVVSARAAVPFLIAWELMAIASYVLIVFEFRQPRIRRAGLLYLAATHTGTLALFAMFAAWGSNAPDLTFASLAARAPALPVGGAIVLALALVGFGLKAGIVPFHFWLPEAHAAAPSHVSALMSGVVIKMGIYGLLRVTMLRGVPPVWWGWLLLALGIGSGVLGVVWALAQHDLKRLLAFHSVENIGIILLGLGVGALGVSYGAPVIAVLGLAGAAFHTLNHALFKSLLFLGAGSVAHATGTRDLDRLGGVARHMPRTAALFLLGSAAIVGLPPLNGFVSEWLVARALLGAGLSATALRMAVLAVAALGVIGALALACFAKVVGLLYLGMPRDVAVEPSHESPAGLLRPQLALAAACVAIGLMPVLVLPSMLRLGDMVAGHPGILAASVGSSGSAICTDPASVAVTVFALGLAAALLLGGALRAVAIRRRPGRGAATWGCGYASPTPRMQYTASSFASPLLLAYHAVAGVRTHRTAGALVTHPSDPVLDRVALPVWHVLRTAGGQLRPLQQGRLSLYLLYVVAALLAMLCYLWLVG